MSRQARLRLASLTPVPPLPEPKKHKFKYQLPKLKSYRGGDIPAQFWNLWLKRPLREAISSNASYISPIKLMDAATKRGALSFPLFFFSSSYSCRYLALAALTAFIMEVVIGTCCAPLFLDLHIGPVFEPLQMCDSSFLNPPQCFLCLRSHSQLQPAHVGARGSS